VRRDEDDPERAGDRRGREHERDRGGEREPEDRQEHDERDRDRDRFALRQIPAQDRVEVVLDRRLPAHVGLDAGRGREPPLDGRR
jgi:hypothetical protein